MKYWEERKTKGRCLQYDAYLHQTGVVEADLEGQVNKIPPVQGAAEALPEENPILNQVLRHALRRIHCNANARDGRVA